MHDASIPDHVPPALVFEFDMYRDARLANDVHLGYRSLHRDAPDVFYTPCNGGHWVVTRMQDLRAMMMDPEHFSSAVSSVPKPAAEQALPLPPQDLDPPEHAKYRALLTPLLSRPAVTALEPLARQLAIELIDVARPHGGCEFVEQFARQMPVISRLDATPAASD